MTKPAARSQSLSIRMMTEIDHGQWLEPHPQPRPQRSAADGCAAGCEALFFVSLLVLTVMYRIRTLTFRHESSFAYFVSPSPIAKLKKVRVVVLALH